MENKHTPGTWYAKDGQVYPTETGKTLAVIPYFDKENEEQKANAKLIAAAPDLLEACKMALEVRRVTHHGDDPLLNKLDAAIAKYIY